MIFWVTVIFKDFTGSLFINYNYAKSKYFVHMASSYLPKCMSMVVCCSGGEGGGEYHITTSHPRKWMILQYLGVEWKIYGHYI